MSKNSKLKVGAKISLIVLLLLIIKEFAAIYQTFYQLESPIIPASAVLMIIKSFISMAFIATIVSIVGLILYFYEKYVWLIALTVAAIICQECFYYWVV